MSALLNSCIAVDIIICAAGIANILASTGNGSGVISHMQATIRKQKQTAKKRHGREINAK